MKINVLDIVGLECTNKSQQNKIYKVLNYQFKKKKQHIYEIQFLDSGNIYLATRQQIKNNTCKDLVELKKEKRLKTEAALKERNRLIKRSRTKIEIPGNIKEKNILAIDLATYKTGISYHSKGIIKSKLIEAEGDLLQRIA